METGDTVKYLVNLPPISIDALASDDFEPMGHIEIILQFKKYKLYGEERGHQGLVT
jgi:hypothetical protein